MIRIIYLTLPIILLTGCIDDQPPPNVEEIEVELRGASSGFRYTTNIVLKDTIGGVNYNEQIVCQDASAYLFFNSQIGKRYKVFKFSNENPKISFYKLKDNLCDVKGY